MSVTYTVRFNLDDIIAKLGLNERGRVQTYVTNEILTRCDTYVPFRSGALRDSGHIENGTDIVWDIDNKARRLYYGEMDWNWSNGGVQEGGLRGPYWVERMLDNGGLTAIENGARRIVKR